MLFVVKKQQIFLALLAERHQLMNQEDAKQVATSRGEPDPSRGGGHNSLKGRYLFTGQYFSSHSKTS